MELINELRLSANGYNYVFTTKYLLVSKVDVWDKVDLFYAGKFPCADLERGARGPEPSTRPPILRPKFCCHRDTAVRCQQNLAWAPLTEILDPHLETKHVGDISTMQI